MRPGLPITARELEALDVTDVDVLAAVEKALRALREGRALQALKTTLRAPAGNYFQAMQAALLDEDLACVKWVRVIAEATAGASVQSTLMLSALSSGELLAAMDAAPITAKRTAAMTAVAARAMAKPRSESIGFVGCGIQARAHLSMLRMLYPTLTRAFAFSRSVASARDLCAFAERQGLQGVAVETPRDAIEHVDIVVTSVPASDAGTPRLDGAWLGDGAFCSMVDLGRSWQADSLRGIEWVATDAIEQSAVLAAEGKLVHPGRFDYELADLIEGRPATGGRRILVFGGMPVCDIAAAALYYERLTHPSSTAHHGVTQ